MNAALIPAARTYVIWPGSPLAAILADFRAASVSVCALVPKSSAWLFATLNAVKPAALSVLAQRGDARKTKQPFFALAAHRAAPPVASVPSRFATARSAVRR